MAIDKELQESAQALIDAGHDYFRLMSKRNLAGGCIWLTDADGAMVIFTRGEYRHQLLRNIEIELDTKKVFNFGVAELESDK